MNNTGLVDDVLKTIFMHPEGVEVVKIIAIDLLEPIRRVKYLLEPFNIQDSKISDFLVKWVVSMFRQNSTNINDVAEEINFQYEEAYESIGVELMSLTSLHNLEDGSEERENLEKEIMWAADEISLSVNQYIFDTLLHLGVVQGGNGPHSDLSFFMDYHPNKYYALAYVLKLKPGFDWDYVRTGMCYET